jgi:hypothetical protein
LLGCSFGTWWGWWWPLVTTSITTLWEPLLIKAPLLKLSNQMMDYFTTSFNPSVSRLVNECLASLSLEFELLDVDSDKLPALAVKSTSPSW